MKRLTSVSFSFYSCCLWLLFASLCTLCSCNQTSDQVQCIATERLVLIEFKNSLEDPPNLLSSWSGEDCCRWSGVVCDDFTHHVHELRIRGLCLMRGYDDSMDEVKKMKKETMLGGRISPSLMKLEQLRFLDLSCNYFDFTPIPTFIGSLQNLRYLNLSYSRFAGDIPHQLGNLSALLVLDLHDHAYGFDNLQAKNLKWIENIKHLQYLIMGSSNLEGASDWFQVINTLPSLQELHFSFCRLTQFPTKPTTFNFTSLIVLDLSYNSFTNLLPRWIFSLPNLDSLDLSGCFSLSVSGFDSMPLLRTLRLSRIDFGNSPSVLKGLPSLGNLSLLDLSGCHLSDPILNNLQNMSQIVHLDLLFNNIVEEIPGAVLYRSQQ